MKDSDIQSIFQILKNSHQTLAVAESATGGYISHRITSSQGASEFYLGSVTSYSPTIKTEILKVNPSTIETFGIVSSPVAAQMAEGIRSLFGSTYSISTTGWADGDGDEHESGGTVWIGISGPEGSVTTRFQAQGSRQENIRAFSEAALKAFSDYVLSSIDSNRLQIRSDFPTPQS